MSDEPTRVMPLLPVSVEHGVFPRLLDAQRVPLVPLQAEWAAQAVNAYEPMRALLQKCATALARSLVEWCDGCGRKREEPGPCPHCSADGRHVATTADAPDCLCALLADLRAGVEPKP